jgi:hypothetical protein
MRSAILFTGALLGALSGGAVADCTNNRVTGNAITTLLNGNLVCGRPAAAYPGAATDRWQEEHLNGGTLVDYKKGPSDPVDPRATMGTWARSGNSVVYVYNRFPPPVTVTYDGIYQVGTTGNTYSFCQGSSEIVRANVVPNGGTGCGGVFPP